MVQVHPAKRSLLGISWSSGILFDARLPSGVGSAPKILLAVAEALQWSFRKNGVTWVAHYLDDFITMGIPSSQVCQSNIDCMEKLCHRLRVPIAVNKSKGPLMMLTFLGFELDLVQMVVSLPKEKL